MKALAVLFSLVLFPSVLMGQTNEQRSLIVVVGAPGESEYATQFSEWASLWKQAATNGAFQTTVIGLDTNNTNDDRTLLLDAISAENAKPSGELWLVFLGHGTFDGHTAKFNLRGPDISSEELATALKPCQRPLVVIQCASASGPFLSALSATNRVIITATKSGYEVNATRFGGFLARAIGDASADLDKDGQVSLLEAFLLASRQTEQSYKDQGRLMTEHALLDDNGDGLGTPSDWFKGLRAIKTAAEGKSVDGIRANQMVFVRGDAEQKLSPEVRARRDELERQLSALRSKKANLHEDDYYRQLETLLVEIAKIYQTN